MLPFRKILCPTDYSEPSNLALDRAGELAAHFGAALCVLHVIPPIGSELGVEAYGATDGDRELLNAAEDELCALIAARVPAEANAYAVVRFGFAADEIEHAARVENADLIVIATHGLTGWRHLVFGSVTEKVMRHVACPLLVVHPPQEPA